MLYGLLLSTFCIGLTFFIYLKKIKTKAAPDYSHIIFKEYSINAIEPTPAFYSTIEKKEVKLEEKKPRDQQKDKQEDLPTATLNFDD